MVNVARYSESEIDRLKAAVLAAYGPDLQVAGKVSVVVFEPREAVRGVTVVGTVGPDPVRLDVSARKGAGNWHVGACLHGQARFVCWWEVP